ncbi:hypothetical protein GCM10020331_056720 [Ectobacillus funiculus]
MVLRIVFEIEERLKKELQIPVMHDDQHGTAVVTLAAAISACKSAGIDLKKKAKVGQIGLGAAGLAISRMLMAYGVANVFGIDKCQDAKARLENYGGRSFDSIEALMGNCDIIIATTGVPELIKQQWVRPGQVILALSNPKPEIEPELALQAGGCLCSGWPLGKQCSWLSGHLSRRVKCTSKRHYPFYASCCGRSHCSMYKTRRLGSASIRFTCS